MVYPRGLEKAMKISDLPAEKLWFIMGIAVGAAIHGPVTVMVGL